MVMYEIWSLGEKPFRDIEAMNVNLCDSIVVSFVFPVYVCIYTCYH